MFQLHIVIVFQPEHIVEMFQSEHCVECSSWNTGEFLGRLWEGMIGACDHDLPLSSSRKRFTKTGWCNCHDYLACSLHLFTFLALGGSDQEKAGLGLRYGYWRLPGQVGEGRTGCV